MFDNHITDDSNRLSSMYLGDQINTDDGLSMSSPTFVQFEVTESSDSIEGIPTPQPHPISGDGDGIQWKPADKVVLFQPSPMLRAINEDGDHSGLLVYSRRPRRPTEEHKGRQVFEEFLAKASKPVPVVCPTPQTWPKATVKRTTPLPPRRSRRIANQPPDSTSGDIRSVSAVYRHLGFSVQGGTVSPRTRDNYTTFFSNPSSTDHVKALAALLGKDLPADCSVALVDPVPIV
jgi:hypothetical protein